MLDHLNTNNTPVVTLASAGPDYTVGEITRALPRASKKGRKYDAKKVTTPAANRGYDVPAVLLKYRMEIQRAVDDFSNHDPLLWAGEWDKVKDPLTNKQLYPSQSEADYGLARALARRFTSGGISGDELLAVVEATFEQSALASRNKWQDRADYRQSTLNNACAGLAPASSTQMSANAAGGAVGLTTPIDWGLKADLRNARVFADLNRGHLLYVHDREKWLQWRDNRWNWCHKGEEIERAKDIAVFLTTEAAKIAAAEPDRGSKLVRETAEAHKEPRIKAMLNLARSEPGMSVTIGELDAEALHLGVRNGVVDLRTGVLLRNTPDLLVTKYCDADFVPGASALRWERFLGEIFSGDRETIDAVQRLVGLTATGVTQEELLIFAVGSGANGKSIFSNVLSRILADYTVGAPSTLLAARRADDTGPRSDMAMLAGARLVTINELPGGMMLDETVAKQLAGRERITARFLHREYFSFEPRFTPWVRTNHRPIITGTDDGIWRRLRIIRFGRTFSANEQDPCLEEKLWAERVGILNWVVEGAKRYLTHGLTLSTAMTQELAQYRSGSDVLGEFLSDKTSDASSDEVLQSILFDTWKLWCENNGYRCGAKSTFTVRLGERGYGQRKSGDKRFYVGLKMRNAS